MKEQSIIEKALGFLEADEKQLLSLGANMSRAFGGALNSFDLIAFGALKRSLSLSAGFRTMILSKNMTCAGALLRMHLDTTFRFYAGFLVLDPHEFAVQVLRGEHIRKMRCIEGKRMTQ